MERGLVVEGEEMKTVMEEEEEADITVSRLEVSDSVDDNYSATEDIPRTEKHVVQSSTTQSRRISLLSIIVK